MSVPTSRPPFQPTYPGVVVPAPVARQRGNQNLARFLKIAQRRALIIMGTTLTTAVAALAISALQDSVYRGEFRLLIAESQSPASIDNLPDEVVPPLNDYGTQVEVLKSQALLSPIAQELQEQYPNIDSRTLAANLSIEQLKGTRILAVGYSSDSLTLTQSVLEAVSEQFLTYSVEQRQTGLQKGIGFVDSQLPELRARVDNLQERLEQFRQQYSLFDPTTRSGDLSELLQSVEQQRQELQTELVQARSLFQSLQSQLGTTPDEAIASATLSESPTYQSLLNQVKAIEGQIAVESARYLPDSPQIAALEDRRDNLLALLEDEADALLSNRLAPSADSRLTPTTIALNRQLIDVANQIETLQARSQSLAEVEQDLAQEFNLVPSIAREYTDLQRELDAATQSLNRFLETREALQIDAAQTAASWELIAAPQTSSKPVPQNLLRNATFGALAGLLLGLIAAVIMEKLDQVFHSTDDLRSVAPLPVIGTIPYVHDLYEQGGLIGATAAASPSIQHMLLLEAFRSLYTSIRFIKSDSSIGSIVVTSTIPGEGKSTIAAGLAQAAAAIGQRVLLVDADLRTPQQHLRAGLPNHLGLTNLVSEGADPSTTIQRTSDPNLFVLTAGPRPADAGRVLASQRMQMVMQQLHRAFDLVIYDTPPASGFADSSLIAAHVDSLILAVGLGRTDRTSVERCIEKVRLSPTATTVVVANGIKPYTTQTQRYDGYQRYYQPSEPAAPPVQAPPAQAPPALDQAPPLASQPSEVLPENPVEGPIERSSEAVPKRPTQPTGQPTGQPTVPTRPTASTAPTAPTVPTASIAPTVPTVPAASTAPVGQVSPSPLSVPPQRSAEPAAVPQPAQPTAAIAAPKRAKPTPVLSEPKLGWKTITALVAAMMLVGSGSSFAIAWFVERQQPADGGGTATPPELSGDSGDTLTGLSTGPSVTDTQAYDASAAGVAADRLAQGSAPFNEAVQVAEDAVAAGNSAQTPPEWSQIAELWQRASALMAAVPETDPRFNTARDRVLEYRSNSEYARQRALSLQLEAAP